MFSLFPFGNRERHPRFQVDAQAVSDPIDVIEITDDLGGQMNLFVGPIVVPQQNDICFGHGARRLRQLDRVVTECPVIRRKVG